VFGNVRARFRGGIGWSWRGQPRVQRALLAIWKCRNWRPSWRGLSVQPIVCYHKNKGLNIFSQPTILTKIPSSSSRCWRKWGQGKSASTLVLRVNSQLLENVYFWKFDTNFGFKSIELAQWNSIFNQQGNK
jgi:hypothetical protein